MPLSKGSLPLPLMLALAVMGIARDLPAQAPTIRYGSEVPSDVKMVYDRGLNYLVRNQMEDGSWGPQQRNAITGLSLMAFLACGEDPNFGQYSVNIRKAVRSLILAQNSSTGFIPDSMYHHGFAMLGLAEAYGAVDDRLIWDGSGVGAGQRSIGASLELAVRAAITAQKHNSLGGWRYSPSSRDADTSVSGAVLMGLLAARNAGIEVPDESIDKALGFYRNCTSKNGTVGYTGPGGGSANLPAVATLVYAVGKRKEWDVYQATLHFITGQLEHQEQSYPYYYRYYMAQALFQADFEAWQKWNHENTRILREWQLEDGSFSSNHGPAYGTAMSLLSLALNFRFLPIYER